MILYVCEFIKLHITARSGRVILVIVCYSHRWLAGGMEGFHQRGVPSSKGGWGYECLSIRGTYGSTRSSYLNKIFESYYAYLFPEDPTARLPLESLLRGR